MEKNNQGLLGALEQYWSIEPKPRLNRRNTFFEDIMIISNYGALKFGIAISVLATAIVIFWSIGGLL